MCVAFFLAVNIMISYFVLTLEHVQYQVASGLPKLARKCEIKHWFSCGADGRALVVRSRDYQIFWDG